MKQESIPWQQNVSLPHYDTLTKSINTDTIVVGAGITGLTTAYFLAKAGITVTVIDKKNIVDGATAATTAFLTEYIDTMMYELIVMFGKDRAQSIIHSHAKAIDEIESIIQSHTIKCDFHRCPLYIYANSDKELSTLHKEEQAAKELGIPVSFHTTNALGFPNAGYLLMEHQAEFHPLKYLSGLLSALQELGVQIFEHTEAQSIQERKGIVTVETPQATITATHAVVATYEPFNQELHYKKAFYTTYVQEVRLPHGALPIGIYEDTLDPYHYIRIDQVSDMHDRALIGGEDHRSDIPIDHKKNFKALDEYAHHILGTIPYTPIRTWSGPIIESIDGLAWIGSHPKEHIFYTTAFSGTGMTYSAIAATIISNSILGRSNSWADIYNIDRIPTLIQLAYKGKDYTNELMGGVVKNLFHST